MEYTRGKEKERERERNAHGSAPMMYFHRRTVSSSSRPFSLPLSSPLPVSLRQLIQEWSFNFTVQDHRSRRFSPLIKGALIKKPQPLVLCSIAHKSFSLAC